MRRLQKLTNENNLPAQIAETIESQNVQVPPGVDMFQFAKQVQSGKIDCGNACIRFDDESIGRHSYEITVQAGRKAPGPGIAPDWRFPPGSALEHIQQMNRHFGGIMPGSPSEKIISEKTIKMLNSSLNKIR